MQEFFDDDEDSTQGAVGAEDFGGVPVPETVTEGRLREALVNAILPRVREEHPDWDLGTSVREARDQMETALGNVGFTSWRRNFRKAFRENPENIEIARLLWELDYWSPSDEEKIRLRGE